MQKTYTAEAYFERLDALFVDDRFEFALHQLPYWRSHRLAWAKRLISNYVKFIVVAWRLSRGVEDEAVKSRYRQQLFRIVRARGLEPHILFVYAIKIALHYHYAAITQALAQVDKEHGVVPDAVRSFSRLTRPKEPQALAS